MTKTRIAVLAAMLVGCAAGATMPSIAAQATYASPAPEAPRYEQFCERYRGSASHDELNAAVRRYGADGFVLASHALDQAYGISGCFSRAVTPGR